MSARTVDDCERDARAACARLPSGPVRAALEDLVHDVSWFAEWTRDESAMRALDAVPAVVRAILGES